MNELQPNTSEACISSDEDECEQDPLVKRVNSYKEAVKCLEDVCICVSGTERPHRSSNRGRHSS